MQARLHERRSQRGHRYFEEEAEQVQQASLEFKIVVVSISGSSSSPTMKHWPGMKAFIAFSMVCS